MITQLILHYLKSHRRLNIPGVGVFMVKESSSEILFSELLKRDDGVLRALLTERGLSEIEVAATIDRFVFELNHSTEVVGGEFVMEGFGVLRREQGGQLAFLPLSIAQGEVSDEPVSESQMPECDLVNMAVESTEPSSRYTSERIKELYSSPPKFRDEDSSLDDLTYSKRQKPLGGYTFVRGKAKRRGVDKVLLFGIIAAVIAIAVIAYGYYVGSIMNG